MSQNYNYQLSFWDEQDGGARILLEHISNGLESCNSLVTFFEERSKLEKDYARRLSAITGKLHAGIQQAPDYGNLAKSVKTLHSSQERLSQSHSKAAVAIHKDAYAELKQFVQELQARYKTVDIKIRSLCNDKITKRQLCDILKEKLNKATIELRDCKLNKDNYLGKRDSDQNDRHLLKWKSIADELQLKLDVLKQEYKASSKHWLHEWSRLSLELQEMEKSRIQFIQLKSQEFAKHCSELAIQEQINMENLTQQLTKYTADQDISSFAYNHGTGRIRGNIASASSTKEQIQSTSSKHVQNVRLLSSQLQKTRLSSHYNEDRASVPQSIPRPVSRIEPEPLTQSHPKIHGLELSNSAVPKVEQLEAPPNSTAVYTTSESSNDSSNPTDFTTHRRRRTSIESMNTSISSLAHSIDDSRRFAKSWNSQNRRKSKTRSQLFDSSQVTSMNENSRSSSMETTRIHGNQEFATDSQLSQRRKSMVRNDSNSNPFKQALDAMRKSSEEYEASVDSRHSSQKKPLIPFQQSHNTTTIHKAKSLTQRVMDGDHYVELPTYNSKGEEVIQYAKALYTFMEANEQSIVNFHVGDYLLLTEKLDDDWFIGEVLDTAQIEAPYRCGIIPRNYIELLT
ncbi:LANO_0H13080g1_1 [Lachancea nothofagi CBS 11611]|uniref:LANO_0H13080g1_1 n=1 Tax=Lachancea nothofagi CBS 11611 TaxID=1266666 RepID=A0A1G4KMG1_9SACH|nr:LANO_0H13080g1_1 [Lachancea nothofagi CBS 11611]